MEIYKNLFNNEILVKFLSIQERFKFHDIFEEVTNISIMDYVDKDEPSIEIGTHSAIVFTFGENGNFCYLDYILFAPEDITENELNIIYSFGENGVYKVFRRICKKRTRLSPIKYKVEIYDRHNITNNNCQIKEVTFTELQQLLGTKDRFLIEEAIKDGYFKDSLNEYYITKKED